MTSIHHGNAPTKSVGDWPLSVFIPILSILIFSLLWSETEPSAFADSPLITNNPVTLFTFGSCNKESLPQPLWPAIQALQPQFFMWLGDAIYGDTRDPKVLQEKYQIQLNQPDYRELLQTTPIIGTWDDHDYGSNNQGRTWKLKVIAQKYFLNFLGEPLNSPRRQQKGVYTSYLIGPPGQQVKIILLDTRYHKSDVRDEPADILGEQQWEWLTQELRSSPAQAHFVISSFSLLSPSLAGGEQWIDYSDSWRRWNDLLQSIQPKGLVILTGDRHFGGMLKRKMADGHTYFELMSSGLTHIAKPLVRAVLQQVYGRDNVLFARNFGAIHLQWGKNSDEPLQMTFSLHSDQSMTSPAWSKIFLLHHRHWELQP